MSRKAPERAQPDTRYFEKKAASSGHSIVAGLDEAGRGPLAGPVVASAVVVRRDDFTTRIDDSKKLSSRRREAAFIQILERCDVGIGVTGVNEIDRLNIYRATGLAMKRAVDDLEKQAEYLLIDGKVEIPGEIPGIFITRGESRSISIACASIIAKVYRDRLMMQYDRDYPMYGFCRHKGYGTREHMQKITEHGMCDIHRKTFGPFGSRKNAPGADRSP